MIRYVSIFIYLIFTASSLLAGVTCEESFQTSNLEYSYVESFSVDGERLFNSYSHMVRTKSARYLFSEVKAELKPSLSDSLSNTLRYSRLKSGEDKLFDSYKERRKWSDEFIKELKEDAKSDLMYSSYLVAEHLDSQLFTLGMAASLKLIKADKAKPEYLLPIERHLSKKFAYNQGIKIEPSNFIQYTNDAKATELIASYWLNLTKNLIREHELDVDKYLYYTYGDARSLKLYRKYGFQKIEEVQLKTSETKWYVLAATPNAVLNSSVAESLSKSGLQKYVSAMQDLNQSNKFIRKGFISTKIINRNKAKDLKQISILIRDHGGEKIIELYDQNDHVIFQFPITEKLKKLGRDEVDGWMISKLGNLIVVQSKDSVGIKENLQLEMNQYIPLRIEYKMANSSGKLFYDFTAEF